MAKVIGSEFRTLGELVQRLQELQQDIQNQVADLNRKATTIVTWSFDINERLKRLDQREQEITRREKTLLQREDKIRDYSNIEARMTAHDQELKNAVNLLTLEKKNLEGRLRELESRESTVNNLALSMSESISDITEKLNIITKIEGTLNEGLSSIGEKLSGTAETTSKSLHEWQERLEDLFEAKSKELSEVESSLHSDLATVATSSKEMVALQKSQLEERGRIMELINQSTNLLASITQRETNISQKEDDLVRREKKLGDLQHLEQDLQKKERHLREEDAELRMRDASLQTYASELAKSRKQVDETLKLNNEFQKNLQKTLNQLLARTEQLQKQSEDQDESRKKLEEHEKQLAIAEKELESKKRLNEEHVQTLLQRSKKLEEGITVQLSRLNDANKASTETYQKESEKYLAVFNQMGDEIKQMSMQAAVLKGRVAELSDQQSRTQYQVNALMQRKKQLESEISLLEKNAQRLQELLMKHDGEEA